MKRISSIPLLSLFVALLVTAACGGDDSAGSVPDGGGGGAPEGGPGPMADGGGPNDGGDASDGSDASTKPQTGLYVVNETFNAMTTAGSPSSPWTVTTSPTGSVKVAENPFPSDKSVAIDKPDGTGSTSLGISFAPQEGRVAFEAKVKAAETAGFKAISYIFDAKGNAVASVAFQDGNIQAYVGAVSTTVQTFNANQWYRVRVVVDTTAGVFDLYVDGVRKEHDVALRTPSSSVQRIAYFIDGTNTGTLFVDNVKIFNEAAYIGAPKAPLFDPRTYGARGDGTTNDTAAVQAAIAAAAGTGGSVVLTHGTYLTGTLTLKSHMTFFVDPSAVLLGSSNAADFPTQTPATGNTQLGECQRALLYAPNVTDLTIDGGGVIDGQGDAFSGVEATRPILIWSVLSKNVTVQNLYLRKGAVWSLVSMESDHVLINDINLQSNGITHDGIDIVDGTDITVQGCAINSGDDAMCLKSGVRRGLDTVVVTDSVFSGNNGGSNGIKIGTGTYGAIKNIAMHDTWVKDVQYAAMAVESRQGSDVDGVHFDHIEFTGTGAGFFVYLGEQNKVSPTSDVPKLGSMTNVSFTDIHGSTSSWGNSPHQASLVTGNIFNGITYSITNLTFRRVAVSYDGGSSTVPGAPVEAAPDQYPESNMFGDLPASAYYLRHVQNVTFDSCTTTIATPDARPKLATDDVTGLTGTP